MEKTPPYTLTNESISILWNGKPYTVKRGSPNYQPLRDAIFFEEWDTVPNFLTAGKGLEEFVKGKFTLSGDTFLYDGEAVPEEMNRRIVELANEGKDPTPIFKFYERLSKNPSYRSVKQLWSFLNHQGIPLTDDGCFLAYKGVKQDYTDCHTGTFDNRPGSKHEMDRNKVSDDPNTPCHEGFHVGAKEYATSFGPITVICKVDPENVVCVPYDSAHQKMRVCKYEVIGNYGSELPNTVMPDGDIGVPSASYPSCAGNDPDSEDWKDVVVDEDEDEEDDAPSDEGIEGDEDTGEELDEGWSDDDDDEEDDVEGDEDGALSASADPATPALKTVKGFTKLSKMNMKELLEQPLEDLRKFAANGLKIVGASKIPGGKTALVGKIMKVRGQSE